MRKNISQSELNSLVCLFNMLKSIELMGQRYFMVGWNKTSTEGEGRDYVIRFWGPKRVRWTDAVKFKVSDDEA